MFPEESCSSDIRTDSLSGEGRTFEGAPDPNVRDSDRVTY